MYTRRLRIYIYKWIMNVWINETIFGPYSLKRQIIDINYKSFSKSPTSLFRLWQEMCHSFLLKTICSKNVRREAWVRLRIISSSSIPSSVGIWRNFELCFLKISYSSISSCSGSWKNFEHFFYRDKNFELFYTWEGKGWREKALLAISTYMSSPSLGEAKLSTSPKSDVTKDCSGLRLSSACFSIWNPLNF